MIISLDAMMNIKIRIIILRYMLETMILLNVNDIIFEYHIQFGNHNFLNE